MKAFIRASLVLVALCAVAGGIAIYSIANRGLSTRAEPTAAEAFLARSVRNLATPRHVRSMRNPVQGTDAVFEEGLKHFAEHCATCHANDGSGETDIGRNLYPRAPDMRAPQTQELSDGELFWIIENGIRLTGMPAWSTGTPEGERASWVLVHFMRRLPRLTDEEIGRMEELNPRTAEEWRAAEEARRFLAGEDVKRPASSPHKH